MKQRRAEQLKRQVRRLERRRAWLQQKSDGLARYRLLVFGGGFVGAMAVLLQFGVWAWLATSALWLVAFVGVVRVHRRVERALAEVSLWLKLKQTHLARMGLDWAAMPTAVSLPLPPDHPFALDLDLIGERSLLRLLDTAVSHEGSRRLYDWLLATDPSLTDIQSRQALVAELVAMPHFRDKLALKGTQATAVGVVGDDKWPGQRVLAWLEAPTDTNSLRPALLLMAALAALNLALVALDWAGVLPPLWPISWLVYGLVFTSQLRFARPLFEDAYFLEASLRRLGILFQFLESYRYGERAGVRAVCAPFLAIAERPSTHLRRVTGVLTLAGLRQNPFLWLALNALVPWDLYTAYRLEQCKTALRTRLPLWLDRWVELEALGSLATFAWLNPAATFPTITTDETKPLLAVTAVAHPLIPEAGRVSNDFHITNLGDVAIITGSNMAGKSSFLRALGVNLALAYAGGPVVADCLQTRHFHLYTSIRVADSVTDGFSYFYAEVRRLQGLLAALAEENGEERPLFFLIDEIFRGTNNRERLIGSRSFVRALVGQRGVGLIATHDLELVKLADETPTIRNFHFRDDVVGGQMVFDYTLHPGPCPTTNALKIMRFAGLPVEEMVNGEW